MLESVIRYRQDLAVQTFLGREVMSEAKDISELISELRAGDDKAAADLWETYFERLVRLAQRRLPPSLRRSRDEEDVALSAFHSFVKGVKEDRFPNLQDESNLWGLLIVLTTRKVQAHLRHQTRQKRGGGKVRGESVFMDRDAIEKGGGIGETLGHSPSPELAAELAEAYEGMLDKLEDDQLRQIAILRMEGFLVDEIATKLEVSKRAVERRLQLIRKIWTEGGQEGQE